MKFVRLSFDGQDIVYTWCGNIKKLKYVKRFWEKSTCTRKAKSKMSCTVFASQYCHATDEMHFLALGRTLTASRQAHIYTPVRSTVRMEPNLNLCYRFFLYYTSEFFCMVRCERD